MSDDLKMCIIGLEKYWDDRQLKKVFEGRNIEFKYLNKRKGHSVGFVTFENVEQKKKNIPMISQIKGFKGRSLLVDNLTHKSKKSSGRRKRNDYDEKGLKRQKVDTSNKTAKDAVTPNWHISYDEQLLAKEDKLVKSLKNFRRRTRKDIFRAHGGNKARVSVNWENFPRWLRPAGGFAGNLSWLSQQEKQNNNKNDSSSSSSSSSSTTTQTKEEGGATSSEASKESIPTHGLPCPIEKIVGMTNDGIPSQCGRYRYRNKCEFTVGNNKNGELCLGFRVSTFGDTIKVESPSECDNIPQAAKNLCARFELFLKGSSLPMYDVLTHDGVYRQLTVQCSGRTNDLRGMVQVKLEGIDNDVWEKELARLSTWCDENNIDNTTNKGLGLTGMLVQRYDGPSMPVENDPLAVPKLLWGKPDLEEHLTVPSSDTETPPTLKFLVSPGAFFQVNTPGCELLYSIVGRFAKSSIEDLQMPTVLSAIEKQIKAEQGGDEDDDVEMTDTNDTTTTTSTISIKNGSFKSDNSDITVLDVCCGTGTIGLCVAASNEKVKKVVGVELCEAAVLDAKRNAKLNNQGDTAHFFAAKAEAILPNLLSTTIKSYPAIEATLNKCGMPIVPPGHRCVAIVDPPRAGLHPKVIKALRNCDAIDTLIYVSCNPFGSFVEDAIRLCLPENDKNRNYGKHCSGKPFVPLRAAPVDMFPDTSHCELVMAFSRNVETLDKNPIPGKRRDEKEAENPSEADPVAVVEIAPASSVVSKKQELQ